MASAKAKSAAHVAAGVLLIGGGVGATIYIFAEVIPDAGLLRGAFQVFPRRKRIRYLEAAVTAATWTEGVVLRYGGFYGPGTGMTRGGEQAELIEELERRLRAMDAYREPVRLFGLVFERDRPRTVYEG